MVTGPILPPSEDQRELEESAKQQLLGPLSLESSSKKNVYIRGETAPQIAKEKRQP